MSEYIEQTEANKKSIIGKNSNIGNWVSIGIFLMSLIFYGGVYFGVFRGELDAKPDEKRVREIIKEELINKFNITDGEVLKSQFGNLEKKVDFAIELIKEHMLKEHK